jgi:GTPase SAR1 family protein
MSENREIIVIYGPAGSGKTKLINSFTTGKHTYLYPKVAPFENKFEFDVDIIFDGMTMDCCPIFQKTTEDNPKNKIIVSTQDIELVRRLENGFNTHLINLSNSFPDDPMPVKYEPEPTLAHEVYEIIERLLVGKPGTIFSENEMKSNMIMQGLIKLHNHEPSN